MSKYAYRWVEVAKAMPPQRCYETRYDTQPKYTLYWHWVNQSCFLAPTSQPVQSLADYYCSLHWLFAFVLLHVKFLIYLICKIFIITLLLGTNMASSRMWWILLSSAIFLLYLASTAAMSKTVSDFSISSECDAGKASPPFLKIT